VLQFIHSQQVIHRDIKPKNIIRRQVDGKLFLVDFGVSKFATETALARTGTVIGTQGYAAPEQSEGKIYFSSDLFGLGRTCFHLLTDTHPSKVFSQYGDWEKYLRINLNKSGIGDTLKFVLTKLLQPDISQRYQSAEEVLKNLCLLKRQIHSQPFQPSVAPTIYSFIEASQNNLRSAVGIDYSRLQKLLAEEKWQEVDEETRIVMLRVARQERQGFLRAEDIEKFPSEDLNTINQLWLEHSNKRFGFSVQKHIFQSLGGEPYIISQEIYNSFADCVGWRVDRTWLTYEQLTSSLDALPGHLPCRGAQHIPQILRDQGGHTYVQARHSDFFVSLLRRQDL
jgi:serine/threonine protein kinase